MGTVTFEPYDYGVAQTYKKTRFFRDTLDSLGASTSSTITNGAGLTQVPMYTNEDAKTTSQVTSRSYEIYIDETEDASPTEVQRLARITTDSSKTVTDGYDVYVSNVSPSGTLLSEWDLTFINLHANSKDFVIVVVAEDV